MACLVGSAALVICACSATNIKRGAELVRVTNTEPGRECKFLGDVTGSQGNRFTGGFTPDANLETGARNDLMMLDNYLHDLKLKLGASKSKLDDFEEEVPFSYMLNIECPVLIGNLTDDERQTIGEMDRIRKKRNAIIHKGEEVSEQEALEAIRAGEGIRSLLARHPITT